MKPVNQARFGTNSVAGSSVGGVMVGRSLKMKNSGPDTVAAVASATMLEVAEAARDQYDIAVTAIRRNPLPSIAVAAGIGFICALMVR